jgi:glycosyltransferase EpsD
MEWFAKQNWEVHVAANGNSNLPFVHKKYRIPIERSPFHLGNLRAYRALKSIIAENHYDIIHCHTPLGGVLARLASRKVRKRGTKVLYTAHGFHFCKGASLLSWLIYYPVEKSLARVTDCLITINEEDYGLAKRKRFNAGRIERVHGVGVDTDQFRPMSPAERIMSRQRFGFEPEHFLMFYAAEFNKNKNHQFLIHALAVVLAEAPEARLLLAGEGPLLEDCRKLAERLGVRQAVHFLGFREDIAELLPMCDAAVSSSLREGLPVNIIEAMCCGLPIVAVRNRGHRELVADRENGFLVAPDQVHEFARCLLELYRSPELCRKMGGESLRRVRQYSLKQVEPEMVKIYSLYGSAL